MAAEFGYPQWVFGLSSYGVIAPTRGDADRVLAVVAREGRGQVIEVDVRSGAWQPVELPFEAVSYMRVARDDREGNQRSENQHSDAVNQVGKATVSGQADLAGRGSFSGRARLSGRAVFWGGSSRAASGVHQLDLDSQELTTLKLSSELIVDPGYLSKPKAIEFPTENGLTAFGFYYPPQNKDFRAPEGACPPLLVFSHGGPTSATSATFNLSIQYWTSRGFAVLDVNYGGSTGYGRAYRQRLNGNWGVVDVDDCVNGAQFLVAQGLVDGARLIIRGSSAGGYTTLAALTFRKVFKAGASYYGIGDLTALARDTHKFEARYTDKMVGPYPEREDLYRARSPLFHVDQLSTPVIFFQGLEDQVVPPNQAERMVDALRKKGVPVAYVPFEGEQHGFRQAKNIQRALEAEYYFYAKVFGFEPAEELAPVEIENL
jgi:dipeptidyl aminopeptidase/acylaminoacyl peptidase